MSGPEIDIAIMIGLIALFVLWVRLAFVGWDCCSLRIFFFLLGKAEAMNTNAAINELITAVTILTDIIVTEIDSKSETFGLVMDNVQMIDEHLQAARNNIQGL